MTTKEQFGANIKAIRERKDYTVRQVALWSGISSSYLSQVENAKREIPSPKTLRKIANGLRITENEIFELAGLVIDTPANSAQNTDSEHTTLDPNQLRVAAHIDDNLDEDQLAEIERYIELMKLDYVKRHSDKED